MDSMVVILLWAWIIQESRVCSVSTAAVTDGTFIEQSVDIHNKARSSVNPPASDMLHMTWDEGLAITARAWAKKCLFKHNIHLNNARDVHPTFSSVGENIWAAYPPSTFEVKTAITSWVDEKQHYDYETNTCSHKCGHYTQVVWASSYKVGCAVQLCPNGVKETTFADKEGVIFVCNYATGGNVNRRRPYESKGTACSGCEGTCVENLCWSKERDSQRSYSWTPHWDSAPANSGSARVIAVVVIRPLALICTFMTAYAVRYFYPDIFCYE